MKVDGDDDDDGQGNGDDDAECCYGGSYIQNCTEHLESNMTMAQKGFPPLRTMPLGFTRVLHLKITALLRYCLSLHLRHHLFLLTIISQVIIC